MIIDPFILIAFVGICLVIISYFCKELSHYKLEKRKLSILYQSILLYDLRGFSAHIRSNVRRLTNLLVNDQLSCSDFGKKIVDVLKEKKK